jgi:hypothetical protein
MPKMAEPKALVDRRRGEGPNTLYIRSEGQSESRLPTVRGRRDAVDRSALSRQEKRSPRGDVFSEAAFEHKLPQGCGNGRSP